MSEISKHLEQHQTENEANGMQYVITSLMLACRLTVNPRSAAESPEYLPMIEKRCRDEVHFKVYRGVRDALRRLEDGLLDLRSGGFTTVDTLLVMLDDVRKETED